MGADDKHGEAGTSSIETRQSWTVALAAVAMLALAAGGPMTVVIGLVPIAETLGGGRSLPSLATSLAYFGTGLGGVLCGLLAGRFGQRAVAMLGGFAIFMGLAIASLAEPWSLLVGIGIGVGLFGNGALFPPMLAYVSLWFDRRRGTALALVSSGQYIAGFVWPSVFERSIAAIGWRWTMLAYGVGAAAIILALAALVVRPAPVQLAGAGTLRSVPGARVLGMRPNLALALMALASFLCCVPMAMPASHLVALCGDLGIRTSVGAAMLSVLLLAAFVARQFWGWLSDRIGGLWTVLIGGVAQTFGMMGFLATQDEAGLFFAAAAYGLGFGGIVPAYVLAVRELFPAVEVSWRVPALLLCSLTGMAFGAWLAGAIYDAVGFYAAAWWAGIAFNIAQVLLVGALVLRQRGGRSLSPALA
ncbi:MFS transporter [Plastoroseomonas arctica]|uniref:MFS transporter n=1 Tax=Plastoroseomonas arctica TaxID=1509237 RepID=A0AAF1KU12_9PROT|nr:MFS transporter [Plastoroseomonas arctica]MBR0655317.1 MFS transporter [Plastoroseomonas arctica]